MPVEEPSVWVSAIDSLLRDDDRRMRMGRTAVTRMARFSLANAFEAFWDEHHKAAAGNINSEQFGAVAKSKDLAAP